MTKILATCAALAMTAAFAMPGAAVAAEKRADGVRNIEQTTIEQTTDVSAQRRYRRHAYRYYGPRYGSLPAISSVLLRCAVLRLRAALLPAVLRTGRQRWRRSVRLRVRLLTKHALTRKRPAARRAFCIPQGVWRSGVGGQHGCEPRRRRCTADLCKKSAAAELSAGAARPAEDERLSRALMSP